jgi:hypothetical protein
MTVSAHNVINLSFHSGFEKFVIGWIIPGCTPRIERCDEFGVFEQAIDCDSDFSRGDFEFGTIDDIWSSIFSLGMLNFK